MGVVELLEKRRPRVVIFARDLRGSARPGEGCILLVAVHRLDSPDVAVGDDPAGAEGARPQNERRGRAGTTG